MTEKSGVPAANGPSHRSIEAGVAIAMIVFALIVITGSIQVGIGWVGGGPRPGFFPFYCGLFVLVASVLNLLASMSEPRSKLFAEWGQLGRVMSVVIPSVIYVVLVPYVGMYLASVLLIIVFMKWLGRYNWVMTIGIAVGVMIATFFVFERWFLVPLPKGPIETYLGF
jgi:hypothetical protein